MRCAALRCLPVPAVQTADVKQQNKHVAQTLQEALEENQFLGDQMQQLQADMQALQVRSNGQGTGATIAPAPLCGCLLRSLYMHLGPTYQHCWLGGVCCSLCFVLR